jgi:hypothetical protein
MPDGIGGVLGQQPAGQRQGVVVAAQLLQGADVTSRSSEAAV